MNDMPASRHQIFRVRREVRRRKLTVAAVEQVTPRMRRIRFESAELRDFESAGFDDHVKLFVPAPDGSVCMRDYTPRAFDTARGSLTIDFAIHQAGPATSWVLGAQLGDRLEIGGPRGSTIVADDFDWYLLIGDETALPAMARMVEQAAAGARVVTIGVVDTDAERQQLATLAAWSPVWVLRHAGRDDAALVISALADIGGLPEGDGYIWIAGEALMARALRDHVIGALGHNKAWVKASGYWQEGQAGAHEKIGE